MRVLLVTALLDAVAVAALALIQRPSQVPLLYGLLVLQFTCNSFYDPARKALIPLTVPPSQLHLATTIDSFAWSLTGGVGRLRVYIGAARYRGIKGRGKHVRQQNIRVAF